MRLYKARSLTRRYVTRRPAEYFHSDKTVGGLGIAGGRPRRLRLECRIWQYHLSVPQLEAARGGHGTLQDISALHLHTALVLGALIL
ncbi:hypothetical protein LshimejAT787_0801060 [Lyophyllum shimeji]|uniref:Uncharacterized protein n=1 Tax=Lyophyllum shimeji TaxID=47721 RepID=A0A9P3PQM1_LYOSH|nr:hypothetical protein LshimejAT787_0801060 [Lyophyllum shimeji]